MSDLQEATDTEGGSSPMYKDVMESVAYKGANTLHLTLFDGSTNQAVEKVANATANVDATTHTVGLVQATASAGSPFRHNSTSVHLMMTLDQVAAQSEEDTGGQGSTIYLNSTDKMNTT